MTRKEAGAVLALMTAAWPRTPLSEPTAHVWIDVLGDVDADDGLAAARRLITADEYFPSIARYLEVVHAVIRSIAAHTPPELPPPPPSAERRQWLRDQVDGLRTVLANADTRDHDHHEGWENCPVCKKHAS